MPRAKTQAERDAKYAEYRRQHPYVPKGPSVRATRNQLVQLNQVAGLLEEALRFSGGRGYVTRDAADMCLAPLAADGRLKRRELIEAAD